eukprot:GAFH01005039.1.p2 GENE.GAFH01005039.1~~GAFH01005039.1.p2  ORF type:complete len:186 (+),score=6.14 GAFH01005039.1:122-679(+)
MCLCVGRGHRQGEYQPCRRPMCQGDAERVGPRAARAGPAVSSVAKVFIRSVGHGLPEERDLVQLGHEPPGGRAVGYASCVMMMMMTGPRRARPRPAGPPDDGPDDDDDDDDGTPEERDLLPLAPAAGQPPARPPRGQLAAGQLGRRGLDRPQGGLAGWACELCVRADTATPSGSSSRCLWAVDRR